MWKQMSPYYRWAKGKGTLLQTHRPSCQHLLDQSTCLLCQSNAARTFTMVARFLISSNFIGGDDGSPPCHNMSFRGRDRSLASRSTLPI
jgi:hypothetical protein